MEWESEEVSRQQVERSIRYRNMDSDLKTFEIPPHEFEIELLTFEEVKYIVRKALERKTRMRYTKRKLMGTLMHTTLSRHSRKHPQDDMYTYYILNDRAKYKEITENNSKHLARLNASGFIEYEKVKHFHFGSRRKYTYYFDKLKG